LLKIISFFLSDEQLVILDGIKSQCPIFVSQQQAQTKTTIKKWSILEVDIKLRHHENGHYESDLKIGKYEGTIAHFVQIQQHSLGQYGST